MKKALFFTLGCKLNQAESGQIAELWRRAEIAEPVQSEVESPDVIFVNGCAVTEKASAKTRHAVTRLAREYPGVRIIVGGCAGQADPQVYRSMPQVYRVVGVEERFRLDWLSEIKDQSNLPIKIKDDCDEFSGAQRGKRARAFLKIQDGCDQGCTFCIIPSLRGHCRSLAFERVMSEAGKLVSEGAKELVLTGVRIGAWGSDLAGKPALVDLIEELANIPGLGRLRLGSLEPWELDEKILRLICEHPRVCGHLHIPLQHTHPAVIKRMGRPPVDPTLEILSQLDVERLNLGFGADIIIGFPGESDEEFGRLTEDIKRLSLTYLHVFCYSARPGTIAASSGSRVSDAVMKDRLRIITSLANEKRREFALRQVGRTAQAISDLPAPNREWVTVVTANYAKVRIAANRSPYGELTPVTILGFNGKYLTGEVRTQ